MPKPVDEANTAFTEDLDDSTPAALFEITVYDFIRIDKYIGDCSDVVIPSKIADIPVTQIGDNAFEDCLEVTSVTMPDSLIEILGETFAGCSSLRMITIPPNVISIADSAFWNCDNLTTIRIPEHLYIWKESQKW